MRHIDRRHRKRNRREHREGDKRICKRGLDRGHRRDIKVTQGGGLGGFQCRSIGKDRRGI